MTPTRMDLRWAPASACKHSRCSGHHDARTDRALRPVSVFFGGTSVASARRKGRQSRIMRVDSPTCSLPARSSRGGEPRPAQKAQKMNTEKHRSKPKRRCKRESGHRDDRTDRAVWPVSVFFGGTSVASVRRKGRQSPTTRVDSPTCSLPREPHAAANLVPAQKTLKMNTEKHRLNNGLRRHGDAGPPSR